MATTDTRPGFRLPWSTNSADGEGNGTEPPDAALATDAAVDTEHVTDAPDADVPAAAGEAPEMTESTVESETSGSADAAPETVAAAEAPKGPSAAKKPNKFLADLTRAMQTTAESSRTETMERFTADAKTATERVQAAATDEATELRRVADEDISGIRDWSKAEIARIREETEHRISARKADLEEELEAHSGTVDQRIERVNARVAYFEQQVAEFYERLFAEEDPTRFAAMAEQLPEPPSLDIPELDDDRLGMPEKAHAVAAPVEAAPEPVVEAQADVVVEVEPEPGVETVDAEVQPETIEATAETAEAPEAPEATEPEANADADAGADTRLEMLESAPDFEAAEAEAALAAAEAAPSDLPPEEIPTIADEVLAARLAGLVPDENSGSSPIQTTKVVVTGLVSVASIAGFKRHLGRLQGVTTVGVSSGPDGEFVFSVHHVATMDLAAGITSLPGFESRITNQSDGAIEVAARDPEAHD